MFRISELELEVKHVSKKSAQAKSIEELFQAHFATLTSSFAALQESQAEAKGSYSVCFSHLFACFHHVIGCVRSESEGASKLQADIRVLEMRIKTLDEKVQDERRRTRQADKATAAAQAETSSLKSDISRLEAELKSKAESKRTAVQELNDKIKRLESQVQQGNTELQLAQMENSQLTDMAKNNSSDKKQLEVLENKIMDYKKAKYKLSVDLESEKETSARLQAELKQARGSTQDMENTNVKLVTQVKELTARVKKLNEIIVELKGSIRVFCRVRPVDYTEDCRKADIDELVRYPEYNLIDFKKTMFEFDQVFDPGSTQELVYEEVEPFVRSAMGGLRVCIFA